MKRIALAIAGCLLASYAFGDTPAPRDGLHDFDFALGAFHTHIHRLLNPLTGSHSWVEYEGTKTDTPVLGGSGGIEQIEADGSAGHLELMTVRLYRAATGQWSLTFSAGGSGEFEAPMFGEFRDGVGTFMDTEDYKGRSILVRQLWSAITPNSYHFEQAFSDDFGSTWETNFKADLTRNAR